MGRNQTGAYRSPKGRHRHHCAPCNTVWEHSDERRGDEAAHTCPGCGRLLAPSWCRYIGPEAPQFNDA